MNVKDKEHERERVKERKRDLTDKRKTRESDKIIHNYILPC